MIRVTLTREEHARFMRPTGHVQIGGFQGLLNRLQAEVRPLGGDTFALEMTAADAERVVKYADSYGEGTYQGQLRVIAPQVREAMAEGLAAQGSLFGEVLGV